MTSAAATTSLSVRGEAQRTTAPDQARVLSTLQATADSKVAAVAAAHAGLAAVVADLDRLGGEVLSAESTRAPLTWSAQSMRTTEEHDHDKVTGMHGPTGRHQASITLVITVRDFALLDAVSAALNRHDSLNTHSVSWSVDDDNAEWALLRADAIKAALLKGQDYAAALGGAVIGVDHVADAGLLGGDRVGGGAHRTHAFAASMSGAGDDTSVDPVPQILSATIEARFTAVIGALPTR